MYVDSLNVTRVAKYNREHEFVQLERRFKNTLEFQGFLSLTFTLQLRIFGMCRPNK